MPEVSFEDHRLTSFSGLVLFMALFQRLGLMARLRRCFAVDRKRVFGLARVVMQLVIHVLLGFRRLRDRDYYARDPLIARALGVRKIPDVSTMTRTLAHATSAEVSRMAELVRDLTLERLEAERLARVTVDFDGSVLSTKGHAEGAAMPWPMASTCSRVRVLIPSISRIILPGEANVKLLHRCIETRLNRSSFAFSLDSGIDSFQPEECAVP